MKIFLSHQLRDSAQALLIAERLKMNDIQVYLDIIDPETGRNGDDLSDHIRQHLGTCSGLMAVVSEFTKTSWWVPWEIGIATEKDHPITTFARDNTELPQYLKKWPYLRTMADLDTFVRIAKQLDGKIRDRQMYERKSLFEARRITTKEFHRDLKLKLGQ